MQLKRERDRLQLLLEVNNAVVSHLNMNDMFVAISASLQRVIQQDGCSLMLYDPETKQYRVHVLLSDGGEFIEEGLSEAPLECPSGYTLTNRKPAVLREEDLKRMAECSEMAQRMVDKGVKSFCAVPLVAHDKQLGALNAGRYCDTVFTDDEVELLSQVAQQVAIAVENGLAYQEIDELKEKLSTEKLYLGGKSARTTTSRRSSATAPRSARRCRRSSSSRRPTRRCWSRARPARARSWSRARSTTRGRARAGRLVSRLRHGPPELVASSSSAT